MKMILTLVGMFSWQAFAISTYPGFKSIECVDSNPQVKAEVYIDVTANVANSSTGIRFEMGNIIPVGGLPDGSKDYTAAGDMSDAGSAGATVALSGSFGTLLTVDLETGSGLVSGPLKYDPATGRYVGEMRVKDYPVKCTASN